MCQALSVFIILGIYFTGLIALRYITAFTIYIMSFLNIEMVLVELVSNQIRQIYVIQSVPWLHIFWWLKERTRALQENVLNLFKLLGLTSIPIMQFNKDSRGILVNFGGPYMAGVIAIIVVWTRHQTWEHVSVHWQQGKCRLWEICLVCRMPAANASPKSHGQLQLTHARSCTHALTFFWMEMLPSNGNYMVEIIGSHI